MEDSSVNYNCCIRCLGTSKYEFDLGHSLKQIKKYEDKWVLILRREGVTNNREGLCPIGMPRDSYNDGPDAPKLDVGMDAN